MNTHVNKVVKYLPPSQRNNKITNSFQQPKMITGIPKRLVEKKSPEFSLNDNSLFPTLDEVSIGKNRTIKTKTNGMSFAAVAKHEDEDEDVDAKNKEIKVNECKEGWVYIRLSKNNNSIEYKYEPQLYKTMMEQLKNQIKYEEANDLRSLKSRIARLQLNQDRENHRLGDLSEFHDAPSIKDQLDNAYNINENENTPSYINDDYDGNNNVSDSENNISLPEK